MNKRFLIREGLILLVLCSLGVGFLLWGRGQGSWQAVAVWRQTHNITIEKVEGKPSVVFNDPENWSMGEMRWIADTYLGLMREASIGSTKRTIGLFFLLMYPLLWVIRFSVRGIRALIKKRSSCA